jgi:hypothetical protein
LSRGIGDGELRGACRERGTDVGAVVEEELLDGNLAAPQLGQLSISEIAQVMHKSEGAVSVLLHRALSELRQLATEADV